MVTNIFVYSFVPKNNIHPTLGEMALMILKVGSFFYNLKMNHVGL